MCDRTKLQVFEERWFDCTTNVKLLDASRVAAPRTSVGSTTQKLAPEAVLTLMTRGRIFDVDVKI